MSQSCWHGGTGLGATDQTRPFAARPARTIDREPHTRARRHPEFGGVTDHVRDGFVRRANQRILDRVAVAGLDHQATGQQVAFAHLGDGPFRLASAMVPLVAIASMDTNAPRGPPPSASRARRTGMAVNALDLPATAS